MDEQMHKTSMTAMKDFLVISVPEELSDETLEEIQRDTLGRIEASTVRGVLIDLSAVMILDSVLVSRLLNTEKMITLMGAQSVFVGINPMVAASLVNLNIDFGDVRTTLNLEEGLQLLEFLVGGNGKADLSDSEEEEASEEESPEGEEHILPDERGQQDHEI